jgi:hypothetical protein
MPGKCKTCLESKGSFHFFCPNCGFADTFPKWDAPFEHKDIYRREEEEVDRIQAQREAAKQNQMLKEEQAMELQKKWAEWRELSKEEQTSIWLSRRSAPEPQTYGVSAVGAEKLVAHWLDYLGEEKVAITKFQSDGGVDVQTNSFCCQVKNYDKTPVSVAEVREILGAATAENLTAMLFTSSALSQDAVEFCEKNDVVAIKYSAEEATLVALSSGGRKLLEAGQYFDPVDKNWCICRFCETIYQDPNIGGCELCNEYKGIMAIEHWEAETGIKLR